MSFFLSLLATLENFFFLFAIFSEVRRHIQSLAESYAYSLILLLSILSVSIHLFFLFRIHRFYFFCDILFIIGSIYLFHRNRQLISESFRLVSLFVTNNIGYSFLISFSLICMFIKGFLLPPTTWDSQTYHLTRIMMMQNEGQLFLNNFSDYRQDIMPIGYDILYFLYLRFFTDYGLATYGFLSYTAMISGIYSLVSKIFPNNNLDKIVCIIASSLSMFVVCASSTKNDLILASIAVVCFLSFFNLLKTMQYVHFYLLIISLLFGLNIKFTFASFFLSFVVFFGIYFLNSKNDFSKSIRHINVINILSIILPLLLIYVFSTVCLHNFHKYGNILGSDIFYSQLSENKNLSDIIVNLIRFLFRSIDFPLEFGGEILTRFHDSLFGRYRNIGVLFPDQLSRIDLSGSFFPTDVNAWYGLWGMPILFAILFSVIKGTGFIRVLSISVMATTIITILKMPWTPWNGRFYAITFASGIICLSFVFDMVLKKYPIFWKYFSKIALIISIINLVYLSFFLNIANFSFLKYLYKDRTAWYYHKYFSNQAWRYYAEEIPPKSKILLVAGCNIVTGCDVGLFNMFLQRPDLNITATRTYMENRFTELLTINGSKYNLSDENDFKAVQQLFDIIFFIPTPNKHNENFGK